MSRACRAGSAVCSRSDAPRSTTSRRGRARNARRGYVFPAAQLGEGYRPLAGLDSVTGPFADGYSAWVWLTTPRPSLDGRSRSRFRRGAKSSVWPRPPKETVRAALREPGLRPGPAPSGGGARNAWSACSAQCIAIIAARRRRTGRNKRTERGAGAQDRSPARDPRSSKTGC